VHSGRACYDHFRATLWRERLARRRSRRRPRDPQHRNVLRVDRQRRLHARTQTVSDSLGVAHYSGTAGRPRDAYLPPRSYSGGTTGAPCRSTAAICRRHGTHEQRTAAQLSAAHLETVGFTRSRSKQTHTRMSMTGPRTRTQMHSPRTKRLTMPSSLPIAEASVLTSAGTARTHARLCGRHCAVAHALHRLKMPPGQPRAKSTEGTGGMEGYRRS
jgi:hypothetical protein